VVEVVLGVNGQVGSFEGSVWSTAPVIMTGTVHRPLELPDPPANSIARQSLRHVQLRTLVGLERLDRTECSACSARQRSQVT
jgi:hypothetical protein